MTPLGAVSPLLKGWFCPAREVEARSCGCRYGFKVRVQRATGWTNGTKNLIEVYEKQRPYIWLVKSPWDELLDTQIIFWGIIESYRPCFYALFRPLLLTLGDLGWSLVWPDTKDFKLSPLPSSPALSASLCCPQHGEDFTAEDICFILCMEKHCTFLLLVSLLVTLTKC